MPLRYKILTDHGMPVVPLGMKWSTPQIPLRGKGYTTKQGNTVPMSFLSCLAQSQPFILSTALMTWEVDIEGGRGRGRLRGRETERVRGNVSSFQMREIKTKVVTLQFINQ